MPLPIITTSAVSVNICRAPKQWVRIGGEDNLNTAPETTRLTNQSQRDYAEEYGENCFEFYDQIYGSVDPNVINGLHNLAAGKRALELGIGTGRIALPLAARGVDISGIEASPSMIAKLQERLGGRRLEVVQGDFADSRIVGPFSLIFALVSTFYLLPSPDKQQGCFYTAARLLSERGVFLLENYEPLSAGSEVENGKTDETYVFEQIIETFNGPRCYRVRICYATPAQLDRMAENAGLRLRERWNSWRRDPHVLGNPRHISLYERNTGD
jgi:SAM-dependent methyltransferase